MRVGEVSEPLGLTYLLIHAKDCSANGLGGGHRHTIGWLCSERVPRFHCNP